METVDEDKRIQYKTFEMITKKYLIAMKEYILNIISFMKSFPQLITYYVITLKALGLNLQPWLHNF